MAKEILFNMDASSGGTDIVAMIVRKFTNMDSGKALLASDIIFVLLTFYNFESSAFDPLRGLLSLLGLLLKSLVVDNLLESLNQSKKFLCITAKRELVEETGKDVTIKKEYKFLYSTYPLSVINIVNIL